MPGTRLPIAQRLILHHVHFTIHFDPYTVRIAMIGGDVVADDVAQRSPNQLDVVFGQHLTSALQFAPILHLECNVMERGRFVAHKIHGVMVNAAAHENEMVADPVGCAKAQDLAIEGGLDLNVAHAMRHVPEFDGTDTGVGFIMSMKAALREDLDLHVGGIAKDNSLGDSGRNVGASLVFHALTMQCCCKLTKVTVGRN